MHIIQAASRLLLTMQTLSLNIEPQSDVNGSLGSIGVIVNKN